MGYYRAVAEGYRRAPTLIVNPYRGVRQGQQGGLPPVIERCTVMADLLMCDGCQQDSFGRMGRGGLDGWMPLLLCCRANAGIRI